MKKAIVLILSVILAFTIPYGFAKSVSNLIMDDFVGSGAAYSFFSALSHRMVQFVIVLGLFALIFRKRNDKMGFNFEDILSKLKLFKWVFIIWPILTLAFFLLAKTYIDGFNEYLSNLYPLGLDWFFAKLGRDVLLLDALAEEVLNRALIISLLSIYWKKSHAVILSVPIFSLAHIQVNLIPFTVIGYDTIQLCLTMFTGLLFAYSYVKTKNIFVPILLHGYTNMMITLIAYLIVIIT
ncbi:MAG: CPBP family intramembrane metalloprotease [Clostridiales bacterium]|nr:CPBP family intramembrane metalloprotease [Clostridiales bacterium]